MLFEHSFPVPAYDRYTAHMMVDARIKDLPTAIYRWGFHDAGMVSMRCVTHIIGWKPTVIPPTGTVVRFTLDAHIRCWIGGIGSPKRRVSQLDYHANMAWIESRAKQQFGLDLINLDFDPIKAYIARQPNPFIMEASRFRGVATVSDPDLLERTMIHGIANAKAFGFGFLLIAPWEV